MGTRAVQQGAIGEAVARNVRAVRDRRGLSQAQLAAATGDLGRPLLPTAIAKIEAGDRRVDVDDLAVLAAALNVAPARLLVPDEGMDDVVAVAPALPIPIWSAWQWATGSHPLATEEDDLFDAEVQRQGLDFMAERPIWLRAHEAHPLARAISHLEWAARRALQHRAERGLGAVGLAQWLRTTRRALDAVDAELTQLTEENDDAAR